MNTMQQAILRKSIVSGWMLALLSTIIMTACFTEEPLNRVPIVSFEGFRIAIDTDIQDSHVVKIRLSSAAHADFRVKLDLSGTAIENEHYTVPSKEVAVHKGEHEAMFPITFLTDNIRVEELTLRILIAPGMDYAVDPKLSSEMLIKLTKEISLAQVGFTETSQVHTNPFNGDTIRLLLTASEPLRQDAGLQLLAEGSLTAGIDFLINRGSSPAFVFPSGVTSHEVEIMITKKDQGGFRETLTLTLIPENQQQVVVGENASISIDVYDPMVDLSPMLRTPASLGGQGYQIRQAIKAEDSSWSGNVIIDASTNNERINYLRSHRNMTFIAGFNCIANTSGGDVLRLANMLWFTSDTTIADYGTGRTTRFFNPTDSLLRFIAEGTDITKGRVSSPRQLFTANLILRADWESGSNPNRPWQHDSRTHNGIIANSTIPTFHTMEVWLEKLEGTFDFTAAEPEIIFDAWFSSNSPYFMRNPPEELDIVKDGELIKISYRYYPRL